MKKRGVSIKVIFWIIVAIVGLVLAVTVISLFFGKGSGIIAGIKNLISSWTG